jgi:hypothetical protein
VFLGRPDISLLNAANPALLQASFRHSGAEIQGAYRFGPGAGDVSPEFPLPGSLASMQEGLRMIDGQTMLGRWPMPDISAGLFLNLRDYVETGRGRPAYYWVLTRRT